MSASSACRSLSLRSRSASCRLRSVSALVMGTALLPCPKRKAKPVPDISRSVGTLSDFASFAGGDEAGAPGETAPCWEWLGKLWLDKVERRRTALMSFCGVEVVAETPLVVAAAAAVGWLTVPDPCETLFGKRLGFFAGAVALNCGDSGW